MQPLVPLSFLLTLIHHAKLDDGVHEAYKRKHFPPSYFAKSKPPTASASAAINASSSITQQSSANDALPTTLNQMVASFSNLRIEPSDPPTSASPTPYSPLSTLPEELLITILLHLADLDMAAFARLSLVCKRLAYLIHTEDRLWRSILLSPTLGFPAMHYRFACTLTGRSLSHLPRPTPSDHARLVSDLLPTYAHSHRAQLRGRPRLRFNGCYISTVNYTRAGGAAANSLSWGAGPVHVVTYFRYLRFFRDGAVVSLLTTAEPGEVVHYLDRRLLPRERGVAAGAGGMGGVPGAAVMKDALRGRWRLMGPLHRGGQRKRDGQAGVGVGLEAVGGVGEETSVVVEDEDDEERLEEEEEEEEEVEGDVIVETQGVIPAKYTYVMRLAVAHAGKTARNNKLAWKGFWSYNKLTDDWAPFGLKNDKAFYWSRVKSYERAEEEEARETIS